ncbi:MULTISPECIES: hypothetical protein [unclassified Rhizobium]|uniref:hypothetical protein n=1 Tax=unclassified Rhizobium TaxID=2613769 RepID=UPI000EA9D25C|nr:MULTISPECIES: hypothetical protein [unclassified Rhizobium]AYG69818.1 hypothetical protein CCGE531_27365 [Rhizobium sp. CCGE531]AYG76193.1 hypothetical protein CCGE532_26850 [Rhizobium sp. CCGE532]
MVVNLIEPKFYLSRLVSTLTSVCLCAFFLAYTAENAASATMNKYKYKTIDLYMKKSESNMYFYGTGQVRKRTTVSSEEYFKGAPYICTPSGFGRTSHCYNRGN